MLSLPLLAAFQLAAAPASPPRVYDGRAGQTTVAIPKIEADIVVDGNLDEAVWRQAAVLTGFSLYSPVDQRPAPDSTKTSSGTRRTRSTSAFAPSSRMAR